MELAYNELSRDEEYHLVKLAKAGSVKAMHRLIQSITPLIKREATRYANRSCNSDVSELLSEGVLGAYKAFSLFEPDRGFRFGTFAIGEFGLVKAYIQNAVMKSHLIPMARQTLKKNGEIAYSSLNQSVPTGDARGNTTLAEMIADKSDIDETVVQYDGVEKNIDSISIHDLIAKMPDGIEKETIKRVANGMTMREIGADMKCSRMTPQRNTTKAIDTLKKIAMCRS